MRTHRFCFLHLNAPLGTRGLRRTGRLRFFSILHPGLSRCLQASARVRFVDLPPSARTAWDIYFGVGFARSAFVLVFVRQSVVVGSAPGCGEVCQVLWVFPLTSSLMVTSHTRENPLGSTSSRHLGESPSYYPAAARMRQNQENNRAVAFRLTRCSLIQR